MRSVSYSPLAPPFETAILVTGVRENFSSDGHWPAVRDMRRGHARTLGLAGVILLQGDAILYGVEGGPRDVDRFVQMLGVSPCETPPRVLRRRGGAERVYRYPALVTPRLLPRERAWIAAELDRPAPDVVTLSALLSWLALRQVEAEFPFVRYGDLRRPQPG